MMNFEWLCAVMAMHSSPPSQALSLVEQPSSAGRPLQVQPTAGDGRVVSVGQKRVGQRGEGLKRVGQWSECATAPPSVPKQQRERERERERERLIHALECWDITLSTHPVTMPHCNLCSHVFHLLNPLLEIHHRLVLDVPRLQGICTQWIPTITF